jgi:deazaflavin-dependent oxidoreductase (nitroreductase family)
MGRLVTLVVLAAVAAVAAADEPPLPEVAAALTRIQDRSTIELTTTGRKSGNEHTKPIWFVVSDGKIVVQAGKDGKTDWYQNLVKTPTGVARQEGYLFRVRARPVTEPVRAEAIHRLFLQKYTTAWLLSFFGSSIGRGKPMELAPVAVAVGH